MFGEQSIDDDTATAEEKQAIATAQTKYRSWRDSVHILTLALELVAQLAVTADDSALGGVASVSWRQRTDMICV